MSTNSPAPTVLLACPEGLDQIRATFGDIFKYVLPDHTLDPRWQADFLALVALPFPLPLSWDKSRTVTEMTCHKLMASIFTGVFGRLQSTGCSKRSPASADASHFVRSALAPSCRRTPGESQST